MANCISMYATNDTATATATTTQNDDDDVSFS